MNRFPSTAFVAIVCLVSGAAQVRRTQALQIGSHKQLFLDDYVIEQKHNVFRRLHHPVRDPNNPLIRADSAWERPSQGSNSGAYLFGSTALYDEEEHIFKIWYRTDQLVPAPPGSEHTFVTPAGGYSALYATSKDGVHWEKPLLGLAEHDGSTRNNLLPAKDATGFIRRSLIVKDYDERDPSRRYKMLYMDELRPNDWGLRKAYSRNGIHWEMNVGKPVEFHQNETGLAKGLRANGEFLGWDPKRRRFVFHTLSSSGLAAADVDGRKVRHEDAIWELTSPDFENWGEGRELIKRNAIWDPPQWSPGHVGVMTSILYTEDVYIGFMDTVTTYNVEDVPEKDWEAYSTEHNQHRSELVLSRDGIHWTRVAPHWWVLPPGLWGQWDHDHVALTKPIVKDDEILIYYTGNNVSCHFHVPGHPGFELVGKDTGGQQIGYAIGLARLRLDGFASMEAYEDGGTLTTKPLTFDGDHLEINARAPQKPFGGANVPQPFGNIRVEIIDAAGQPLPNFRAAEAELFSGDELHHVVKWKGTSDLSSLQGKPVRLRFYLKNAALYSFQFRTNRSTQPIMNQVCPGCRGRP